MSDDSSDLPVLVHEEPLHRILHVDAHIRVIQAILQPGQVTLLHTHPVDFVSITIEGGRLWSACPGDERVAREVSVGRCGFTGAPFTHRVGNAGSSVLRMMSFEALSLPEVTAPESPGLAGHPIELETAVVRVRRVRIPAGAAAESHQCARPVIAVVVAGAAPGRPGPGEFRWHPDGLVPAVANPGPAPLELLELEWKATERLTR